MRLKFRLALLDIEGTVSPLAFVRDVMFPFAAARYEGYLARHFQDPTFAGTLAALRKDAALEEPPRVLDGPEAAAAYCLELTREDRKATGLKAIQGLIWDEGFSSGELKPPLFGDVKTALAQWRSLGLRLAIYSSGSEHAQKQFFGHTVDGDLRAWFEGYFDTTVGPKKESASYAKIAQVTKVSPGEICFFSDVVGELEAATSAGFQSVLVERPGNAPQPAWAGHKVQSLQEIQPEL